MKEDNVRCLYLIFEGFDIIACYRTRKILISTHTEKSLFCFSRFCSLSRCFSCVENQEERDIIFLYSLDDRREKSSISRRNHSYISAMKVVLRHTLFYVLNLLASTFSRHFSQRSSDISALFHTASISSSSLAASRNEYTFRAVSKSVTSL
jgi:hypothetical protein